MIGWLKLKVSWLDGKKQLNVNQSFLQTVDNGIRKIASQKIAPYENTPLWKLHPVKIVPQNFSPEKIASLGKLRPIESPTHL